MKRRAIFGDVHGELPALEKLYGMLQNYSLDSIHHSGDLIDRGADPAGVVQFCMEKGIEGVMGNHEAVILTYPAKNTRPKNPDKLRSLEELEKRPATLEYIRALPKSLQYDNLLHVHSGVDPYLSMEEQDLDKHFSCVQLVHPEHAGTIKWFSKDKKGIPESHWRGLGWRRWYEVLDVPYHIVAGHSVHSQEKAFKYRMLGGTYYFGVDTGCHFNKNLTALIWPDQIFVSTRLGEYKL
jgi:hypothetical protein